MDPSKPAAYMTAAQCEAEIGDARSCLPVPILPVTVLVLSDFEIGRKTWADEIACVASFTEDQRARPAEIVLAPEGDFADTPPPDWSHCSVPVRVHGVPAHSSTDLKNVGTVLASQDLVAVIEADSPCQHG